MDRRGRAQRSDCGCGDNVATTQPILPGIVDQCIAIAPVSTSIASRDLYAA